MLVLLGFMSALAFTFGVIATRQTTPDPYVNLYRLMVAFGWTAGGLLAVVTVVAWPTHAPLQGVTVGPAVVGGLNGLIALIIWNHLNPDS